MGKYDNYSNSKNIDKAQKTLDKLSGKRKPDLYKIELAQEALRVAKLFETCQIFKSINDRAPNEKVLFSDDNRVVLFGDKLISYDDVQSYRIVENLVTRSRTDTQQKGAVSRAIVGGAVAGGIGAVVGAMSAGSQSHTTQYQTGEGFFLQIFLKSGEGFQYPIENDGIISNKIHPKWLELGTKIQMIIDGKV